MERLDKETGEKNMKIIYFSYPYSDNPKKRTEEIKEKIRGLLQIRQDIIPLIPHLIFDSIWNFPKGYSNEAIRVGVPLMELELISWCDGFCPVPYKGKISSGCTWEESFTKWLEIHVCKDKLVKWEDLLNKTEKLKPKRYWKLKKTVFDDKGKGLKFDEDKPMIALIEPQFLLDVARVLTIGATKYGLENWKRGLDPKRILSALYRHTLAYHKGEKYDSESQLSHLCHIVCNAMFLYWYDEIEPKLSKHLEIEK